MSTMKAEMSEITVSGRVQNKERVTNLWIVRLAAKELTTLILDEDRLRSERSDRKLWKTRVNGLEEFAPPTAPPPERAPRQRQNSRRDEEDAEMRLAIEASKYEEEERQKRDRDRAKNNTEDDDLAKALKLSKEEEELRRKQLEDQNTASLLFDDIPGPSQPQPTGYNQGYQQQPAVDWFGNPLQQQSQNTGFLNNAYAQPQQTGYQNGFGFQPQQSGYPSQPTGYDQFGAQPFLPQQNTMQPQQTSFQNNNPYQQSNDIFGAQPSQQQQQPGLQPGTHNPWAQQSTQTESLKPMQTGSNNPFAQKTQSPQPFQRQNNQPSLGTLYESQPTNQFTQPSQPNPIMSYQAPEPQRPVQQNQKSANPQHARLNALLASGEGQDTFGNTGDLRIPAQHTAPGVFVNSAGVGADRLRAAQTGTNPFFQTQFTGAGPSQGGFGQQMPAQTGPAGGFGGSSSSNPFGARPAPQQNASLIDF